MKLIGDLKKKVDEANTKEEARELIANAGMELTEEEMDAVSGGSCVCPAIQPIFPHQGRSQ